MNAAVLQLAQDKESLRRLSLALDPTKKKAANTLDRWTVEVENTGLLEDEPMDVGDLWTGVSSTWRNPTPLVDTMLPMVPYLESSSRGRGRHHTGPIYSRNVQLERAPMGDVEEIFYDLKSMSVNIKDERGKLMSNIMQDIQSELAEYS